MLAGRPSTLGAALLEDDAPPYDATGAQREDLPQYEPPAPSHNREAHEVPLHTYYLRAPDRKNLVAVPYGLSAPGSFKFTSRGSRLFSKKPEMDVWRSVRASAPTEDEYVAGIWFDTDGPLPWCPRARFVRQDPTAGNQTYKMEARNFSDWTISVDGTLYSWILEAKPFSLVLRQDGRQDAVARFNFSACGLVATGGAEVGDLTLYRDGLSQDKAGVDVILCGLVTALLQFKKMGRHYKNEPDAIAQRAMLPEERVPLHRSGVAQFWSYQQDGSTIG
ncbi:uncharacterized protein CC84DRAFT_1101515 [Paraphaeosphaeria sporulosa]|uniref:Uncharacterized protein n=1 Tax=Paraphaeosphaeria sporulosa TaxID=1460663 RepID=A0A177C365_9PLEO|nr:uncharacterized protein CC84DRAFT_1101515 [Paraphaeosphaeria sporulosa]OAG01228.1 hypothetical protein CC84DRAFT_1101515 [Paraphaeosphaeria sporulosa]